MRTMRILGLSIMLMLALLAIAVTSQAVTTSGASSTDNLAAFKAGAEPDGFRDKKWRSAFSTFSDMVSAFGGTVNGRKVKNYTKSSEDTKYGPVRADQIRYVFFEDKFYGVDIDYRDIKDPQWNMLTKWLLDEYGQTPELALNNDPTFVWWGDKSFVRLRRSMENCYLTIWSQYLFPDSAKPINLFERAVGLGDLARVKQMLEAESNLIKATNVEGEPPLFWSLDCHPKDGGEKVMEFLISKGADVNAKEKDGTTPLQRACQLSQLPMVKLLVSRGADVNLKGWDGETALLSASAMREEIAIYLISVGADIKVKDSDGKTVLQQAAEWGELDLVKLLLEKGAEVNTKDKDGWTPLHESVLMTGKPEIVRLLLEKGADANAKENEDGRTPLHVAVDEYNADAVKLLLDNGADVNAKDKNGVTPLKYAIDNEVPEIADVIRKAGGTQ